MLVRKTNGNLEEYDREKVKRGIRMAFEECGETYNDTVAEMITKELFIFDKMTSKEIKRQVQEALMSINKKVASAYIEKNCDMMDLKKSDDFIRSYIESINAASGSKYDSNANVINKNIVTMGQEIPKGYFIRLNRYFMQRRIKSMYSKSLADRYVTDLENHTIYRHDETAIPGMPYCVAISMYPFLVDGLTGLGGESSAPKKLKAFCGAFVNLVYSVSSQFAGAVATPEFLMYMDFYIRKAYGENYLSRLEEVVDLSADKSTLQDMIDDYFQQIVHSMNMPAGTRGYQSVFWNIGYFDKPYFEGVFGDFRFPDGSAPKWETLSWLQKHFMRWFNKEREKYRLTFPVETMALLTDGNDDFVDKEYADFTAQMWAEGHSFFCYLSNSPDSLSSCCFSKDQKVLWKSSTDGVKLTTLQELHDINGTHIKRI